PLNIIIVGAGIAGLTAAIGLRKDGHRVRVIERSALKSEVGAALTISPNACRVLLSLGLDLKKMRTVPASGSKLVHADQENLQLGGFRVNLGDATEKYGAPFVFSHRVDLHDALKSKALASDGEGTPVELVPGASVVSYDPEMGSVTTEDGTVYTADLIVAADGLRSKAHEYILGHKFPARPSKTTVMRFTLPTDAILADPSTAPLMEGGQDVLRAYVISDVNRYLLQYPCRDNLLQNFVAYDMNDTDNPDTDNWSLKTNREYLIRRMRGFHPAILALCERSDEVMPLWRCIDRDPLPKLQRGRLVVIGDAAHPMYPHQGQGAAFSIEDGGILGYLFSPACPVKDISHCLQLFEKIRLDRVSRMQVWSRL
ncbi:FAD/NAD(P)-binding domain-containing protein, partial [Rhizodiscina lignyota]